MEKFTALYVYANGVTLTIGFPGSGVTVYELHKLTSGSQTFLTQVYSANRKGEVEITFDEGVYGWRVDESITVTVSEHPDVAVQTRIKPAKDPWPLPPPPPPPTKFANLPSSQWNLHYKSLSLRENELMYSLGGAPALQSGAVHTGMGLSARTKHEMMGVHVAATRRGPAYGAVVAAGELTFPTDLLAIVHRLTHRRGAGDTRFLLGEQATRERVVDAVLEAAQRVAPGGVFVLSFAGHGGQLPLGGEADGADEVWQLYDAFLYDDELGHLLSCFDPSVHCVVIADCCFAGGMLDHDERDDLRKRWGGPNAPGARAVLPPVRGDDLCRRPPGASTALIAATGAHQAKVNTPETSFGRVLERLLASGRAPTYRALAALLRDETPAGERATIWCSDERTWELPPLGR